jgi:hypothetical protein
MRNVKSYLAASAAVLAVILGASAAVASPTISVDENGKGFLDFRPGGGPLDPLVGVLMDDPGPGGLTGVMTYDLLGPPSLTAGDVLVHDDDAGGLILDVIRFNNYNTGGVEGYKASLLFYSDNIDGFDALADTFGPPGALYTNVANVNEDLKGFISYHPGDGQPGFVPGFDVSYRLFSEGVANTGGVPEPGTWALMLVGFATAGAVVRSRRRLVA